MEQGWVKIYTSNNFFKSELIRQTLVDHEIEAILMNKQLSSYNIGEVEVYIHQNDFQKALEIIINIDL